MTAPVSVLDAETVEELQPPCDEGDGRVATWAVRAACPRCGRLLYLMCDTCAECLRRDAETYDTLGHTPCRTWGLVVLGLERL